MQETPQRPEKKLNPNREKLLLMSADAKALKEKMIQESEDPDTVFWWEAQTINAILLRYFYKIPEGMELGTFHQWKAKNCMIKKGEKSIVIWGQPLRAQRAEQAKAKGEPEPEEDGEGDYFPMCFLFRADQVLTAEELEAERSQRKDKAEKREQITKAIETLQTVDLDTVI
jgi:hypothetical protein